MDAQVDTPDVRQTFQRILASEEKPERQLEAAYRAGFDDALKVSARVSRSVVLQEIGRIERATKDKAYAVPQDMRDRILVACDVLREMFVSRLTQEHKVVAE